MAKEVDNAAVRKKEANERRRNKKKAEREQKAKEVEAERERKLAVAQQIAQEMSVTNASMLMHI